MKKLLSMFLVLIMMLSVAIPSVFADSVSNEIREGMVFEVSHYNPKYPTDGVSDDEAIANNVQATSELCELISETCYCEVLWFDTNKIYVGLPFDCVETVKQLETVVDVKPYVETAVSSKTADEKISEQLKNIIASHNPQDTIGVSVFLGYKPAIYYGFNEDDFSNTQEFLEKKREVNSNYHQELNKKFYDEINGTVDAELTGTSSYAPMIYLSLKAEDVEKIAQLACVDNIEYGLSEPLDPPVSDEPNNLYEDKFVSKYKSTEYYYNELYYHKTTDGEIDWALVEGDTFAGSPMAVKQVIFDRIITYYYYAMPFAFGYGIYDVATDDFYPLNSQDDLTKFDGLEEALNEIKLGNPLGDADYDGELSILDATYIQRVLAKLCDFAETDNVGKYFLNGNFMTGEFNYNYISDIDMDGERTILDATAIQKKLALLDVDGQE